MAFVKINDINGKAVPALLFTHCQWESLYSSTDSKEAPIETIQKVRDIEKRKLQSKKMASCWENTFENIRNKRYECRTEQLLNEQKYKQERYKALRKESEREMDKLREKTKTALFFEQDACKSLHSALRTSQTEAERLAQVEFNEKLKKIDLDIEAKYAERIQNEVKRYHYEQKEIKQKMFEKKKTQKIESKEMLREAEERKRQDKERQKIEEKEYIKKIQKQMQLIKENEKNEMLRKKAYVKHILLENLKLVQSYKEKLKTEEDEENKAIQIVSNVKMSIAEIVKQKEKEMLDIQGKRQEIVSDKLGKEMQENEKKDESLWRAEIEKYKIELDNKERKRQYEEMLKKERIADHLNHMKEEEQRLSRKRELLKWEIIRRLQREEINHKFTNRQKEQRKKKALDCRQSYLKQIESDIERRMKEKQTELEACQRSQELWKLNDQEFLKYAETVREESKKKGRPLYPIDAAIYKFKKSIGIFNNDINFK